MVSILDLSRCRNSMIGRAVNAESMALAGQLEAVSTIANRDA